MLFGEGGKRCPAGAALPHLEVATAGNPDEGRNLSTRSQTSFWLPTSTDRFYPDFVALLQDGRIFVLEYKGADRVDTGDTKEKTNIGQLWADKSAGKGVFLMAQLKDEQGRGLKEQIASAVA